MKGKPENLEYSTVTINGFEVRTAINENNKIWYCAGDMAKIFGYRDAYSLTRMLSSNEVRNYPAYTIGGWQSMLFINARGVLNSIFKAKTPEAESCREWFFKNNTDLDYLFLIDQNELQ